MAAVHHIRLNVSDLKQAKEFYTPILSWLGFEDMGAHKDTKGEVERLRFSKDGLIFLISQAQTKERHDRSKVGLHHIAFGVGSRKKVDQFYKEVLLKMDGVEIEDPPVDCPEYRKGYYATFFYDPDGIKLEVTYTPKTI
jgi:catechol 2,3-dioxygenase-like lactoylglutathione lyase family enzyme